MASVKERIKAINEKAIDKISDMKIEQKCDQMIRTIETQFSVLNNKIRSDMEKLKQQHNEKTDTLLHTQIGKLDAVDTRLNIHITKVKENSIELDDIQKELEILKTKLGMSDGILRELKKSSKI